MTRGRNLTQAVHGNIGEHSCGILNWENKGVKIDEEFLNNLRFANDLFLCTEIPQELQQMLSGISDESRRMGLKIVDNTPIYVNNVLIENLKVMYTWDNTFAARKITSTKRQNEESWQTGRHSPITGIYSKATLPSA